MKVSKLIELLQAEEPNAEVHFSYGYGDHWRTEVAPAVSSVDIGFVGYSDYHRMDKIEDDEDEIYDEETGEYKEGVRKVIVLG